MKKLLSYLAIYIIWGSTYYAIRVAVDTIPAFAVVGLRFFIGGGILLTFLAIQKKFSLKLGLKTVISSIIVGLLLLVGGNGGVTIAEKKVDSYIAALMITLTPLVVLIYDRVLFKKKFRLYSLAAIFLGFAGVGLLLNKGTGMLPSISPYALFVFMGPAFWSLGTSVSKHLAQPEDAAVNSSIQLFSSGIVALLLLPLVTPMSDIHPATWSNASIIAVGYLTVFGTLALIAYGYLLKTEPNSRIVTYSFVNPPIALALGLVLGKETPAPYLVPAIALIFSGLALMFYGDKLSGLVKKRFVVP
jgi:drug/metabolite transporter (DMT)-like permease